MVWGLLANICFHFGVSDNSFALRSVLGVNWKFYACCARIVVTPVRLSSESPVIVFHQATLPLRSREGKG